MTYEVRLARSLLEGVKISSFKWIWVSRSSSIYLRFPLNIERATELEASRLKSAARSYWMPIPIPLSICLPLYFFSLSLFDSGSIMRRVWNTKKKKKKGKRKTGHPICAHRWDIPKSCLDPPRQKKTNYLCLVGRTHVGLESHLRPKPREAEGYGNLLLQLTN